MYNLYVVSSNWTSKPIKIENYDDVKSQLSSLKRIGLLGTKEKTILVFPIIDKILYICLVEVNEEETISQDSGLSEEVIKAIREI
jgi:myosin heavy subunit